MKSLENLLSLARGLVKGSTIGVVTPFIEAYKNLAKKKNANDPKQPHSWYSIVAQIGAVITVILSEPGQAFLKSLFEIFNK